MLLETPRITSHLDPSPENTRTEQPVQFDAELLQIRVAK